MAKIEFECVCKKCGHVAEANKDKSNENWKVYDTDCAKCGGKVTIRIKDQKGR